MLTAKVRKFGSLVLLLPVLAGCGADAGGKVAKEPEVKAAAEDTTPVTLRVFIGVGIEDKDIQLLFVDPLKKKYPHITIEPVRSGKGTTIQELVAAGQAPDLIYTWNGGLPTYQEFDLLYDMTPLVTKNKTDLGRFDKPVMETLKAISDKGELYALPFTIQLNALYYNKDIFDRRGVAYPKDGMTWEDAMELAKKLSHKEGTVQYRGLGPETIVRLSAPYNLTYIDSKTGKASINSDGWRRVFEMAKSIYAIPNNTTPNLLAYNEKPAFLKDQNLAMLGTINLLPQLEDAGNKGLNWDVAQYPSYKDRPNISGIVDVHVMGITKTSKYKEQGMKVIEVITSEEVQTLSARATARISSLNNKEIQKQLGADMAFLRGKHLEAFFQSAAVPAAVRSQFEDINTEPYKAVMQSFKDFFEGKDINTALREAEEKINLFMDGRKK